MHLLHFADLQIVGCLYTLQRPHATLEISLTVHLCQTSSATIWTIRRNLHLEVDFLQRYSTLNILKTPFFFHPTKGRRIFFVWQGAFRKVRRGVLMRT